MLGSIHLLYPSDGIGEFQVLINPPCNSDLLCDLQNRLPCLKINSVQIFIQTVFCQGRCVCSQPILLEIVKIYPTIFADGIGCACRQSQLGIIDAVLTFFVSNFHNPFPFKFRFSLISQAKPVRKEFVRPSFCKSVMNTRTKKKTVILIQNCSLFLSITE